MSTALAIAGVTAVLRNLLNDGMIQDEVNSSVGSKVEVSVRPPDRVVPPTGSEPTQLNLFLHRVTPNAGWRNVALPSVDSSGRQRLANPPLALDLHYLVSAYGSTDLHAEILLGSAMQRLHETPVIPREAIRAALQPEVLEDGADLPPALRALADSGLDRQIEQIKITPEYLDTEEMSKFWTAAQCHLRPTAAYLVTVVLIESVRPALSPLPVLTRGRPEVGATREPGVAVEPRLVPAVPLLDAVVPAEKQPAARLGKSVDLEGHHMDGTGRTVLLSNDFFEIEEEIAPDAVGGAALIRFTIQIARSGDFPVGTYRIGARLVRPGEQVPRETNRLALLLAPEITDLPAAPVVREADGRASIPVQFRPEVRPGQRVVLVLGQREVEPEPFDAPTGSLDFVVEDAALGTHLVRLRIDGIESAIIDRSGPLPKFLGLTVEIK